MVMKAKAKGDKPSLPFVRRKIAKPGGSRYLAMTKILPEDWEFVELTLLSLSGDIAMLRVKKLV